VQSIVNSTTINIVKT
jgi:hypothetical protein